MRWVERLSLPRRALEPETACHALARWLARAQDTGGGGASAWYDARQRHWAAAYPEVSGYIIPTLFDYARDFVSPKFRERALRMADWACAVQLPEGGVRAGLMDAPQVVPTVFNTGQSLFGWARALQETAEPRYRESLRRAADWLLRAQDEDGAWRRFASPFSAPPPNAYNTRTAYGLARAAEALGEPHYLAAARRNVDWALGLARANGWLPHNDLEDAARPLTHTIAYALRGILEVAVRDGGPGLDTVATAARAIARAQRRDGALPGRLDADWHPAARWSCLTGNAQLALIWLRLAEVSGESAWRASAERALDFNLRCLWAAGAEGVAGGMPGSHPFDGPYMRFRYPSWAAKFMLDALLLWRRMS